MSLVYREPLFMEILAVRKRARFFLYNVHRTAILSQETGVRSAGMSLNEKPRDYFFNEQGGMCGPGGPCAHIQILH